MPITFRITRTSTTWYNASLLQTYRITFQRQSIAPYYLNIRPPYSAPFQITIGWQQYRCFDDSESEPVGSVDRWISPVTQVPGCRLTWRSFVAIQCQHGLRLMEREDNLPQRLRVIVRLRRVVKAIIGLRVLECCGCLNFKFHGARSLSITFTHQPGGLTCDQVAKSTLDLKVS